MSSDRARARVLLVGLGITTRAALDGLAGSFDVVGLIRDAEDETTEHARRIGVPVRLQPTIAGLRQALDELEPDGVVVSSFNRIIGQDVLDRCPFVNVHYAPLPRGRGRATVNWAIINGDDAAWISIHHLVAELDAGGILHQSSVPIGPRSTVTTLYDALNDLQREAIADAVSRALAGDPGTPQDESKATYYCTRVPEDGEIDWSRSAVEIDRLVRALQPPFPPAYTTFRGGTLFVLDAAVVTSRRYEGSVPGRVVGVGRSEGWVDVLAGDGVIRLESVIHDGMGLAASQVVRSVSSTLGSRSSFSGSGLDRSRAG